MNSPLTRTIITTAAAAAVGVTVGALSLGPSASAHSDQQPRPHTTTMRFAAHDGQFAMDDLGDPSPHGPGMGDVVVLTQRLTQHGKTVGSTANAWPARVRTWKAGVAPGSLANTASVRFVCQSGPNSKC